jgi:hypothetical protein
MTDRNPAAVSNLVMEERKRTQSFLDRLNQLVSRVKLGMSCFVVIGQDEEIPNGRYYFQIKCWRMDVITKEMGWGFGGKAYLSPHMTDSELFQVIIGLYKGYWEHEARENFEIDGLRPYGPHISTDALLSVARKVDVRSAKHVEDRKTRPLNEYAPNPFLTPDQREDLLTHRQEELENRIGHHKENYPGTSLDI